MSSLRWSQSSIKWPKKIEAMTVLWNRMCIHTSLLPFIQIRDANVPFVSFVQNLGAALSSNLIMSQHISNIYKTAYIQITHVSFTLHGIFSPLKPLSVFLFSLGQTILILLYRPLPTFWLMSHAIWSVTTGNKWSIPLKSFQDQFHWSVQLLSCSNWSHHTYESLSGMEP